MQIDFPSCITNSVWNTSIEIGIKNFIYVVNAAWDEIVTKCQAIWNQVIWNAVQSFFFQQETSKPLPLVVQQLPNDDTLSILPQIVRYKFNLSSFLSFTSTCRRLAAGRFDHIRQSQKLLSELFSDRIANDILSEWPRKDTLRSFFRWCIIFFRPDDPLSNTGQILRKIFENSSYDSPLDLRLPAFGDAANFQLVLRVAQKFPMIQSLYGKGEFVVTKENMLQFTKTCRNLKSIEGIFLNKVMDFALLEGMTSSCKSLQNIAICPSRNAITADEIKKITFPSTLIRLCFGNRAQFTPDVMKHITTSCPDLRGLRLEQIEQQNMWKELSFPKELLQATLQSCSIDKEGLKHLCASCPDLNELKLVTCDGLRGGMFQGLPISEKMRRLYCLGMELNDNDLESIGTCYPQLEFLSLMRCEAITSEGFRNAVYPATLEEINLFGTSIDFSGLVQILKCAKDLQTIDLSCCELFFVFVANQELEFPQVRKINLSNTWITRTDLEKIFKMFPLLEELDIRECPNLRGDSTIVRECKEILAARKQRN